MIFPKHFVWGASTSAYQVEGAWNLEGKGPSVWDMFTRSGEHVREGHSGREACDHFHRYQEDISLFSQVGLNAYRFSISWPRVMPPGLARSTRRASISTTASSTSSSPPASIPGSPCFIGIIRMTFSCAADG